MHTKIITLPEFLSKFTLRKDVSFAQFSTEVKVVKNSIDGGVETLDDYVRRHPSKGRKERLHKYKKRLYKMLVLEPEKVLSIWYQRWVHLPEEIGFYFEFPNTPVFNKKTDTFEGAINGKYGKLCRASNFEIAYKTIKTNGVDNGSRRLVLDDLKLMFEEFTIHYRMMTPSMFEFLLDMDSRNLGYKELWAHLMLYLNKPSILNPYTYREILRECMGGEVLFAPCMSWNAAQIAFYNSDFNHFISTDVIPSVVENGRNLHLDWEEHTQSGVLFHDDKTIDLYLCPSEQLQKRHKFIDRYRNKVDAVLFCPPYFDLELYDSPEQSVDSFPDYLDWLRGYWEETVKTCVAVMKPGARFGFIISNYAKGDYQTTMIPISNDMSNIVSKYLRLVHRYDLRWTKPVQKRVTEKRKDGHTEDVWIFEKR